MLQKQGFFSTLFLYRTQVKLIVAHVSDDQRSSTPIASTEVKDSTEQKGEQHAHH